MISPLSVVSVASEANIKLELMRICTSLGILCTFEFWYMRRGSPVSSEKFFAAVCHLEENRQRY